MFCSRFHYSSIGNGTKIKLKYSNNILQILMHDLNASKSNSSETVYFFWNCRNKFINKKSEGIKQESNIVCPIEYSLK